MFNAPNLVVTIAHIMDDPYKPSGLWKRAFGRTVLGICVRGQIGKNRIFRARRGNGYYGSILGELYHERYGYFVPSSINNPEGQAARDALAQAVFNWKNVLDEATKNEYNREATKRGQMSGFNKYVGAYVKANA